MFDISELINKAQELVGGNAGDMTGVVAALTDAGGPVAEGLANAGLDQSILENLPIGDLDQVLEEFGVDPAALSEGQLGELAQSVVDAGGVDALDISSLLETFQK